MAKSSPSAKLGPRMKEAWRLYDEGDVVAARRIARTVLEAPESDLDRTDAQDLLRRTRVPRQALWIAALALALIGVLVLIATFRYGR